MRSFPLAEYEPRVPLRIGSLSQCFAVQHGSGEEVLLKQLLPAFARVPAIAAGWLERAERNARLDHPGCSRVLDWGEALGESYLTLPVVAARSLRELLQAAARAGLWPRAEAVVSIAQGALAALAYAHTEFALAHLDLDPRALLLRKDGTVLLTEFGMWSALPAEAATRERFDRGRVAYLCPELAKSLEGDARSDVFSLGAILYELLGKERPFHGATQLVTAMAIAEGRRRPLRELAPQAPELLCDIVETMLAQRPEERFQSAQAALGAFSSCGQGDAAALVEWLESLELCAGPQAGFACARRAPLAPAAIPIAGSGGRNVALAAASQDGASAAPPPCAARENAAAPGLGAVPGAQASALSPPPLLSPPARAAVASDVSGPEDWLAPPPLLSPVAPAPARVQASAAPRPEVRDGHTAFLDPRPVARADAREKVARGAAPAGPWAAPRPVLAAPPLAAASRAPLGPLPSPPLFAKPPVCAPPPHQRDAARAATERAWQEPSMTVFQAKVFAKHATRRRAARAPLPVIVLLSVAFGFAVVGGVTLLWRLIAS